MYATLHSSMEFNDKKQPEHNEYINNEREMVEHVRQILKSQLVNAGIRFAKTADVREFEEFYRYMAISIPRQPEPSYSTQAEEDAKDLIKDNFVDEIVQQLLDDGEASDDMNNDYDNGDGIFHETITDKWYSPKDAIELLDDLSKHEETDSGLWDKNGDYTDILSTKAAYTYGNAVYSEWNDLISNINDIDVDEIKYSVAKKLIKSVKDSFMEAEQEELENMSDDEQLEWCEEYYPESFEDNVKEALQKAVEELL